MGVLSKLLGVLSGNEEYKISDQLVFDKVIGFRGVVGGVGTSSILQNTAIALTENTEFRICVLDTNYLYPTQYPMLQKSADDKRTDFLDYEGDISKVIIDTDYRNIKLVSMYNRSVVDMMSVKDNEDNIRNVIDELKLYFDIIFVDLSTELSKVAVHSAVKCNRIIQVTDESLRATYNLRKSLNTLATLAVPFGKANCVIVNKSIPDVKTDVSGVMENAGLRVIGEIPLSAEIATLGITGKRIYQEKSDSEDIFTFSRVIESIIDEILTETPLNIKYIRNGVVHDLGEETRLKEEAEARKRKEEELQLELERKEKEKSKKKVKVPEENEDEEFEI